MAENKYNVDEEWWDELSLEDRVYFNRLYEFINKSQQLITHPKAKPIGQSYWHTIAFNFAWSATKLKSDGDFPIVLPQNDSLPPLNSN